MTPKAFAKKYTFRRNCDDIGADDFAALIAHVRQCERRRVLKELRKGPRFFVDLDGMKFEDSDGNYMLFDDCARIAAGPKKVKKR